jgi:hypothetical protein
MGLAMLISGNSMILDGFGLANIIADRSLKGLYLSGRDSSKIKAMAGLPQNTKRFRHGRPDRGRC